MTSTADQKSAARMAARKQRNAAQSISAAGQLIQHFPFDRFEPQTIGGVWPLKNEIDMRPLMKALLSHGHRLSLPCTPKVGQPLTFRAWMPEDALKPGPYDTCEPFSDKAEMFPTLALVPLLAFTPDGMRLGYGGGFYDRTLAALRDKHKERGDRFFACGVAYAAQEAPDLPTDEFDYRLDGVLTEQYFKVF